MEDEPPKMIAINHDDYHARHIGRFPDGRQFFLTTPFEPAFSEDKPGCEYIALFIFNAAGALLEAKIESFGPRATLDETKCKTVYDSWLNELGNVSFARIEVAPFSIDRFGTQFGLIPREPEDEDDVWAVELLPGNYMAFFEPWDSGDYDT